MTPQDAFHIFAVSVFITMSIVAIAVCIERLWHQKMPKTTDTVQEQDTLVPGIYICCRQASNPFRDDYAYITVLEVKDGWVKYIYGRNPNRPHATAHSSREKIIKQEYEPFPFDKD